MTVLTSAQVKQLWIASGGDPARADQADCIALHESSRNTEATSANPDGGTNVGLYQLDTPGGKGAGYTVAQLKDPATNTRVAVRGSSRGHDWGAWSTAPLCNAGSGNGGGGGAGCRQDNQPNGHPGGPGWYIYSVVNKPVTTYQATSPADFQRRHGAPPMTNTPYTTQACAQQAIADNFAPHGGAQAGLSSGLGAFFAPFAAIGQFFAAITQASTWIRAGEVLLGLVLVAAGVARITHALPAATKIAKTAGTVALA